MENKSGIYPLEFKVLVLPEKVEETTEGGIYLPEEAKARARNDTKAGVVVEIGGLAFDRQTDEPWPEYREGLLKAGSEVVFSKHGGEFLLGDDGEEYRLMNDRDILAVRSK